MLEARNGKAALDLLDQTSEPASTCADIKRCRMAITLIILSTDTFIIRTVTIAMIMVRLRWSDKETKRIPDFGHCEVRA